MWVLLSSRPSPCRSRFEVEKCGWKA